MTVQEEKTTELTHFCMHGLREQLQGWQFQDRVSTVGKISSSVVPTSSCCFRLLRCVVHPEIIAQGDECERNTVACAREVTCVASGRVSSLLLDLVASRHDTSHIHMLVLHIFVRFDLVSVCH